MEPKKSLLDQSIETKLNVMESKQQALRPTKEKEDKAAVVTAWLIAFATLAGLAGILWKWLF